MTGFGERLKKLRNEAEITQSGLADTLCVHLQTVSRWERDISEPDFSMLGLLAEALGVSLEKLLGEEEQAEKIIDKFDVICFGKGIASFRKLSCESQDDLACAVGVSSDTVSKWERGLICPNIEIFLNLAKHFNVSLSKLYYAKTDLAGSLSSANNNLAENRKKPIKKIVILTLAICLALLVVIAVVLAVCLKPKTESASQGNTGTVNTGKPGADTDNNSHNHLYETTVREPTCTAQGYTKYTCTLCGHSYKTNYVPILGHTTGAWIVDREPTCSVEGSKHKQCITCGTTTQRQSIPTVEHNYTSQIIRPNSGKAGYTVYTCTECDTSYNKHITLFPTDGMVYEYNYSDLTCTLKSVDEDCGQKIEIPSEVNGFKVTAIERNAFEDCVALTEIVIPDSVKRIGMYAFYRCIMLKEVTVPESVTELGDEAFCGCRSLVKAVLPANLTRLKYSLFSDCVNLQSVNIPAGVTVIEDLAFNNCHKLSGIVLPEKLISIGRYAFSECKMLEDIKISDTVIYIGDNAFAGCERLASATFESSLGWKAGDISVDYKLLEDKKKAAEQLVTQCVNVWTKI